MKKRVIGLLASIFCIVLLTPAALAANRVSEMEIEVALRPDGSAYITQIWTTDTDDGTEFYLARNNSGYLSITDFSVSDQNGPYTFVEDWDVNASFQEKANKCGILETDDGVELCWGLSQYGENRYAIEYVLHDLVGSYSDADGFNHRFVDEMSFFPTDVVLTICNQDGTPLSDAVCDIWGFGFDGQVVFEDGVIRAWSESPLTHGNHMTVMVSLDKGVLSPRRTVEDSFETVKERAFKGSDYEELSFWETVIGFLILIPVALAWMILIPMTIDKIQKIRMNMRMRRIDYFRDAPNGGNLNVTHQLGLCSLLCEEDALLGAYLLRFISQGCLDCTEDAPDAKLVTLRLCHPPQSGNGYDDALYTILEAAAGTDGILQPREFERFCAQNDLPLFQFMDSCRMDGIKTLIRGGCLKGALCDSVGSLTRKGQQQLNEILGLKRFLLDFSLIQERGVKETILWQDYMVYALMLGIADQLALQIRELYPDEIPKLERYQRYIRYTGHYNSLMYNAYHREQQRREAARSAGSGGRSSRGGGRGSSGGGRGGTR